MSLRRKKKLEEINQSVELNVMPFIDIFSLLCTFLLFSAVFISMGIHTVQVPFFTNASSEKKDNEKPLREMTFKLDIDVNDIELITKWSIPPLETKREKFTNSLEGREKLHKKMIEFKKEHVKADKIKVTIDDEVLYDTISKVFDAITNFNPEDPQIFDDSKIIKQLFPKIVLESVIL